MMKNFNAFLLFVVISFVLGIDGADKSKHLSSKEGSENLTVDPKKVKQILSKGLYEACFAGKDTLAYHFVQKGADVNGNDEDLRPVERAQSLGLAKLMIQKGARIKDAMTFSIVGSNPKLVLLYAKHGADINATHRFGFNALQGVIYRDYGTLENRVQVAKYFIALGASTIDPQGKEIVSDEKAMQEAIEQAKKEKEDLKAAIEAVDREADQELAKLVGAPSTDKGDKKSN